MPNESSGAQRALPARPNLRQLKDQAKDLLKSGDAASITDAQFKIAQLYGLASWPKLKAHIDSLHAVGQLKQAIETNDLDEVKVLMTNNPSLHTAPMGYANNGPLTWVAECRIPWGPPSPVRLAMAQWMIENGSDVHQGGDGPLMRAALRGERIPMMELLVAHGADVNAEWNGNFPILFASCETVDPVALRWLLEHGADPNGPKPGTQATALDYLIGTYERSSNLAVCVDLLLEAGGTTRYDQPGVLDVLRDRADALAELIRRNPELLHRQFPDLNFGSTGARRLVLEGATLLHVAAEYGSVESAKVLLKQGAAVNAPASLDEVGVGGQTPIFHAVTQFADRGLGMTRLLIEGGADLSVRVKLPGHYETAEEVVECTPLGYALRFPGPDFSPSNEKTVALLRENGASE
jgi:ankyrin repeat protein